MGLREFKDKLGRPNNELPPFWWVPIPGGKKLPI